MYDPRVTDSLAPCMLDARSGACVMYAVLFSEDNGSGEGLRRRHVRTDVSALARRYENAVTSSLN